MRVLRLLSITVVLTIAAAVGAWWYMNVGASRADQSLTLYGNVDIREVELAFEVTGRVAKLMVEEGARVRPGQALAHLQRERYQHAVEQNRGQLTVAEQRLAKLEAGTRSEEIARARALARAARAEAKNAWSRYRRLQDMESKNAVSPQDVDDGRSAAQAAQARLEAARKTLALALAGPREEDIARARGELQMAQAELSLAQRNLADTILRAPAAGVVRSRILEPGDMAAPEVPVFTIALNHPLWVRTYVSETELGNLRPGMAAVLHTDTHPDQAYQGWVGYISPTAEFTPKSVESLEVRTDLVYQARIHVCDARGELRLGMPVTVTIPRQQAATGAEAACRRQKQ